MNIFCKNLRALRISRHVSQKQLAEYLGVALRTYQSYEYGEREPNIASLLLLADFFDISLDYLLGRE